MRSLWSFLAISRIAPSSTRLRPTFQASATRIEYCSMVSGSVVGTISTAIWLPFFASKSCSVWLSEATSLLLSVPVWSTTRPVSCGTATSASAANAQQMSSATREAFARFIARNDLVRSFGRRRCRCRRCRRGRRIEIHLRRAGNFLLIVDREIGLFLVSEGHRGQVGRERADRDVIILHRLNVAVACHGDAVLRALELRHQVTKQRIGFELRIILADDQEPRQRTAQFDLGLLEFRKRAGIVDQVR